MDSFLDDYQSVRLATTLIGAGILTACIPLWGWSILAPFIAGLSVTGAHALWCRLRNIRSPLSMLLLDSTLWGGIMVVAGIAVINAAIVALLYVLTVMFSHGYWRIGFMAAATGWYVASVMTSSQFGPAMIGESVGVVMIALGLAALVFRVQTWLGRMDAQRSQMLGTVSHELRNNLTGMMGLTEIVGLDHELSGSEARELVALAHQQAADASEIVEDLLTATRLESSALSVSLEPVDLSREVETTMRRFSGEGVTVTVEAQEDLPDAEADGLRVRQILRNLVSNAVRYGGPSIRILTRAEEDVIQVVVGDNGRGVPREEEGTLFLPYRRSKSGHSASVGLGLWISRQLAVAMSGNLEYRRVEGWTEFALTLPVHGRAQRRTTKRARSGRVGVGS
jgi:signal transduction histidine kinase